jgi:predicted transcriptional regulator
MPSKSPKFSDEGDDPSARDRKDMTAPELARVARLLMTLAEGERDVISLCKGPDAPSRGSITPQLKLLGLAHLIEMRRQANHSIYGLTDEGRDLVRILAPLLGSMS